MADEITEVKSGWEARAAFVRGVKAVFEAVVATLGPKGKMVVMDKGFGSVQITKDGVTVLKSLRFCDPYENLIVRLFVEMASRTDEIGGDGTTTTVACCAAMIFEGMKSVTAGYNPMDMKRGMEAMCKEVCAYLDTIARDVQSKEDVRSVALIASNHDPKVADLVTEAVWTVGHKGVISIEEAKSGTQSYIEYVSGMQYNKGWLSPFFANTEGKKAKFQDAYMLVCDQKLNTSKDIQGLLEEVARAGKSLVIIAQDVEGECINTILLNVVRGALKAVAIKAPGFGESQRHNMEDIACAVGTTVIDEKGPMKLRDVTLQDLGRASSVVVSKDKTEIIGGGGDKVAVKAYRDDLLSQAAGAKSSYESEKLEERAGRLNEQGSAIYHIVGDSDFEVKEAKDRVQDALNSTRSACEEGILSGGGVALFYAARQVADNVKTANKDQEVGVQIIKEALSAPLRHICSNAGFSADVVVEKLKVQGSNTYGFDAQNGEYCDMFEKGIVDAKKIVRLACTHAVSIACLAITVSALVVQQPKDSSKSLSGGGMGDMGGMGGMEGMM